MIIMPLPPQPYPSEPTDSVLFNFELPAFCRGGPSTEYPKLSTYPEGAQLEISGQNIEGSCSGVRKATAGFLIQSVSWLGTKPHWRSSFPLPRQRRRKKILLMEIRANSLATRRT
jgi:hypothetical protein